MPQPLPRTLLAELQTIVGKDAVISDPERLLVYESDGLTSYRFPPRAVILPTDTKQVAAVMRVLAREKLRVVPRGAGTGLSGGALALEGEALSLKGGELSLAGSPRAQFRASESARPGAAPPASRRPRLGAACAGASGSRDAAGTDRGTTAPARSR